MAQSILSRARNAWNAFVQGDEKRTSDLGLSSFYRPDRIRMTRGNERSLVTSVYNRIALDCSAIDIRHVLLDDNGRYLDDENSGLNYCLTTEANLDQTARAFKQDCFMSLLTEGCIAVVPVDAKGDPRYTDSYDIRTLRVGKIIEWFPRHVRVDLYNEATGKHQEITIEKAIVGIVENPFFAVMNEPNSTLQRLIRKLNILDMIDEQSGSGKLDLIIQLPYTVRTETRRKQAEERRKDIEQQLSGSKFGIAYTDATEHVTQLNRSLENNLMAQIEFLMNTLYGQLGITKEVMDGTADETVMLNYQNRTVEVIVSALVDEMKRKFLSKTSRTQGKSIMAFRDPFRLVPVNSIAEIADKFTRNEIMTSNEIRQIVGMKPSEDPAADELRNKNLSAPSGQEEPNYDYPDYDYPEEENQNGYE